MVECVVASEDNPVVVDQTLRECVEGVAVEAPGQVSAASLGDPLAKVLGRVGLERDREDPSRVGADGCSEKEIGPLGEQLGLAREIGRASCRERVCQYV